MITGILLAAGRGRRMGQTKQLVHWNSQPLVAAAYDGIASVCDEMIVVLGHEQADVAASLAARRFHQVTSDPDAEMFVSLRAGLRAALDKNPETNCMLQLGDHPRVKPETLQVLVANANECPGLAVLPTYRQRGGHPILIPPLVARQIVEADVEGGLRMFWKNHADTLVRIEVDDPGIAMDIDTPEDLANQGS